MALTSFDFQQARVKQVLFKSRLRSVLYGVRQPEADLFEPSQSPLLQWLHTTVRPVLGSGPEVLALELAVEQQLKAGQALVGQYQRGHMEEARAGLEKIDAFADTIEQALQQLERAGGVAA